MASMILSCVLSFFCFKQKTAYEMRISDWSSDVCSSDLRHDQDRSGLRLLEGAAVAAADSKRLPFGYRLLLLFQVLEPSVQAFRQGPPLAPEGSEHLREGREWATRCHPRGSLLIKKKIHHTICILSLTSIDHHSRPSH